MAEEIEHKLRGFSLSSKEGVVIELEHKDISFSLEECSRSLFGKVIGDREAGLVGIKKAMSQIWQTRERMTVYQLGPNFFQFIFALSDDKLKVAAGTSWSFDNQYLILREWSPDMRIDHPSFQEMDMWVQIGHVPLNWLSAEVGLKIGQLFKKIKDVHVGRAGGGLGRCIRILVTVNLLEPLLRCTHLRLGDQTCLVDFKYEKLISFCHYCGLIGHLSRSCSSRLRDISTNTLTEGEYGDWMKALEHLSNSEGSLPRASSSGSLNSHPHESNSQDTTFQKIIPVQSLVPIGLDSSSSSNDTSSVDKSAPDRLPSDPVTNTIPVLEPVGASPSHMELQDQPPSGFTTSAHKWTRKAGVLLPTNPSSSSDHLLDIPYKRDREHLQPQETILSPEDKRIKLSLDQVEAASLERLPPSK